MKRLFGFINKCERGIDGELTKVLTTILEKIFISKKNRIKERILFRVWKCYSPNIRI